MGDMVCESCGRVGIRWMGPFSNLTHTECPHCGGQNCHRAEVEDDREDDSWVDDLDMGAR